MVGFCKDISVFRALQGCSRPLLFSGAAGGLTSSLQFCLLGWKGPLWPAWYHLRPSAARGGALQKLLGPVPLALVEGRNLGWSAEAAPPACPLVMAGGPGRPEDSLTSTAAVGWATC